MRNLFTEDQHLEFREDKSFIQNDNPFIDREPEIVELPKYADVKDTLMPHPIWEGHDDAVAAYDKAWTIAFSNLRNPDPAARFCSPFIDTAFNGFLFMWDSCFNVMYGKYAARVINFQKTLDNLYARQHRDGYICRELSETSMGEQFGKFDPRSTGPNIMAWCEWEYFKLTGDMNRLKEVFFPLYHYHNWMRIHRTWRDGTYWTCGLGCGMDNQPRMQPGAGYSFMAHNGHMVWVDATMQGALGALLLARMAKLTGHDDLAPALEEEYEAMKKVINETLWDEDEAFYYDLFKTGELSTTKTIGAYWALLAEILPPERLERFVAHLENEDEFRTPHAPATLPKNHPDFNPDGGYWRGAVWPPTTYMTLLGLSTWGESKRAYELARNHHDNVVAVFNETGTLWENYAPVWAKPGKPSKPDMVGWGGLGPIAVFIEYILGIKGDPMNGRIVWDINLTEKHGIERYPFGEYGIDLLCEARASADEKPVITVKSPVPVEIELRWGDGKTETVKA